MDNDPEAARAGSTIIANELSTSETPQDIYHLFSARRKIVIVLITSFYGFLSPFSSIGILPATPELAADYRTSDSVINVSNALDMLMMGISAPVWAPLSQVYGRRPIILVAGFLYSVFSLANIFAPDLASYIILRMLIAFHGTAFLVVGSAVIGDIYTPLERGNALSWFLFGGLFGPAVGPLVGGIIVTYRPWQVILELQAALSGFAFVLALLFMPETIHSLDDGGMRDLTRVQRAKELWRRISPLRAVHLLFQPNIAITALASSSIMWSMYTLLTPIRQVLNPRYHLTTPMESALFYLAPGCGYLVGASMGGRYSDWSYRAAKRRRGDQSVPEDRLRSALVPLGIAIPGCILIYGWTVAAAAGGIPVTVITMFLQGVAQLFTLPSLNTYCLEVMPKRSAETIAVNYIVRYLFAAGGTASALPIINSIGLGAASTISAAFLVLTAFGVWAVIQYGSRWRAKLIVK